jgi:hypothetical protein
MGFFIISCQYKSYRFLDCKNGIEIGCGKITAEGKHFYVAVGRWISLGYKAMSAVSWFYSCTLLVNRE